jgi:hypothetical protein
MPVCWVLVEHVGVNFVVVGDGDNDGDIIDERVVAVDVWALSMLSASSS